MSKTSGTSIYHSSIVTISKKKDTEYTFSFLKSAIDDAFIQSLQLEKLILEADTKKTETDKHIKYTIHLDSFQTLPQFISHQHQLLNYEQSVLLLRSLGEQLASLERNNKTILTFQSHHIVVLNDNVFLYMESNELYTISDDKTILIDRPPQPTEFSSPELANITSIPAVIHKNNWMYSIASIVGYFITNNPRVSIAYTEGVDTPGIFSTLLDFIQDTPLLFCLLRCVAYNPHKRVFLYI